MSGGGGRHYYPGPRKFEQLQKLIEEARQEAFVQRLDGDVNGYLRSVLATMNQRDKDEVSVRLDEIANTLSEQIEMERFLLGGSVAKHTYVDGLSDIDALVILKGKNANDTSPRELLQAFSDLLRGGLSAEKTGSISTGTLAATVTYHDGLQIQLLPALRSGERVSVPDATGREWIDTNPRVFQRALTRQNDALNGMLVPTIKLMKSIVMALPEQKQMSGYHMEALALAVTRDYDGPSTPKGLLMHVLSEAALRVLRPIADVTGQSRTVDAYLGPANSNLRRIVADGLATTARKLKAATKLEDWEAVVEA